MSGALVFRVAAGQRVQEVAADVIVRASVLNLQLSHAVRERRVQQASHQPYLEVNRQSLLVYVYESYEFNSKCE